MLNYKKFKTLSLQKNYFSLFIFFFVVGLLWGKFFYYSEKNRNALFKKDSLILLAEKDFLPTDVLEYFTHENNIDIHIVSYSSKQDFIKKAQSGKIDLIAFKSFHGEIAVSLLSKISYSDISNKEVISVDFKNPPYDPQIKHAIPLFWGIKTKSDEKNSSAEKSLLWIESIGIAKNSKFKKQAHEFLDYVLQSDIAVEIIRHKKVASTNKSIEKAKNIESKLKPSFLRKMSIKNISFSNRASF